MSASGAAELVTSDRSSPAQSSMASPQLEPQFVSKVNISQPQETQKIEAQTLSTFTSPVFQYHASLHPVDTSVAQAHATIASQPASPLSAELRVQTNLWHTEQGKRVGESEQTHVPETLRWQAFNSNLPVRTPSMKSVLSAANFTGGSPSPASAVSSPGVGPLVDITPLPSPIGIGSPGPWMKMAGEVALSPPRSIDGSLTGQSQAEALAAIQPSPKKRKAYMGLARGSTGTQLPDPLDLKANAESHARNRSLSEYVPVGTQAPRTRNIAVSGSQTPTVSEMPSCQPMQREEYLAVQRGISSLPTPRPPTPPRSNQSATSSSDFDSPPTSPRVNQVAGPLPLRYEARTIKNGELKRWTAIRQLGKGTFSTVMLATSDEMHDGLGIKKVEEQLSHKSLVAVKICEHGPAGGVDEKKIESSLGRELDILKSIDHPSLVHLKAVNVLDKRAFLVLNYSAGGDLFELASLKVDLLIPSLIRRIFAELVAAVRYLHSQYIVHRDIKLENVLVNLPTNLLSTISDWQKYPHPIVTLTDLGLGRYIPHPPESPLLSTRCGSEDYAAPELLMGQEYDGRSTDAWALGVLLYAIMEGRLPFDPIPNARRQSPTSHRIARIEWSWVKWADKDGEWDEEKGEELEGGRKCVEGLLKRNTRRWGLDAVAEKEWVKEGVSIEGCLIRMDEYEDGD